MAVKSSLGTRQTDGKNLVLLGEIERKLAKLSIPIPYLYLPFFLLIILWFSQWTNKKLWRAHKFLSISLLYVLLLTRRKWQWIVNTFHPRSIMKFKNPYLRFLCIPWTIRFYLYTYLNYILWSREPGPLNTSIFNLRKAEPDLCPVNWLLDGSCFMLNEYIYSKVL